MNPFQQADPFFDVESVDNWAISHLESQISSPIAHVQA